jgi:tripartite-type tricarboxylate transporter receptor subunit TctC
MKNAIVVAGACCLSLSLINAAPAAAQDYPNRPIRLVIPWPTGGGVDVVFRLWSQQLAENLGQPIVVDNRPGAGSTIGIDMVAKSKPDGYTLGGANISFGVNPYLLSKLPYDTDKDLAPVSLTALVPLVLSVNPSVPARSVKELVALAKSRPGSLNSASGGNASATHMVTELFSHVTGAKLVHIPYKGGGPQVLAGVSGETPVLFLNIAAGLQHIRSGRLIALGITTLNRHPLLPEVPTIAEAIGMPDFSVSEWTGVVVPAGTPPAVISRLHQEIVRTLAQPEVRERIAGAGAQVVGGTPGEMSAFLKQEATRWPPVIKAVGIRFD